VFDPHRRAIETVLTVRDTMKSMADGRVPDLIGDIVDATADTGIDRADRWSIATYAALVAVAKLLSQQEPKR